MNRLKSLRKEKKITQEALAKKIGIAQNTLSQYESETNSIPDDIKFKLAEMFNVSIGYLLGFEKNFTPVSPGKLGTRIPVLGSIPAGVPVEMVEDILDYEDISQEMLTGDKEYFALKVSGNSMYPKYFDGDVVIIQKASDCDSGRDAIITVNGNDATLKRLVKNQDGIILQPLNPEYVPLIYSNKQIKELPITILGFVVEIRRQV